MCCQPYDEEYLAKADPPIKFLSFHSYLRKLIGGVDKSVTFTASYTSLIFVIFVVVVIIIIVFCYILATLLSSLQF